MSAYEMAIRRRSIRRFQNRPVPREVLQRCIDAARLAPTGANLQPLEFVAVDDARLLPHVFSTIGWAKYITPAGNPPPGSEPTAYVVVLKKKDVSPPWALCDIGAAMENIILVALEEGIGSCPLLSVKWEVLRTALNIPESYETSLLIAMGYPDESPVEEASDETVKYWKDEDGVLHVPKRRLETVLHWNAFQEAGDRRVTRTGQPRTEKP